MIRLFFVCSLLLSTQACAYHVLGHFDNKPVNYASTKQVKYDRKLYKHWSDFDGDCQNTRHELLIAYSRVKPLLSRDSCRVIAGKWVGPYTGKIFTNPSDVDIDHIVPLANAHKSGAWRWSAELKERFANDPENLLVVDDATNQRKGAKSPDQWLPPSASYRCIYVAKWVRIKNKYNLYMGAKEHSFINNYLKRCEK